MNIFLFQSGSFFQECVVFVWGKYKGVFNTPLIPCAFLDYLMIDLGFKVNNRVLV